MFIAICPHCGLYCTEKEVQIHGERGTVRCLSCGGTYEYRALPLFVALGASGVGKTTLGLRLQKEQTDFIVLDGDLLWRSEFTKEGNGDFFSLWMNMALNISQCGKPVLLTMGGVPQDFKNNPNAKFFSSVHVLGLYAEQEDLVRRLKARPAWRGSASDAFIEDMIRYNKYVSQTEETLNTSAHSLLECAEYIKKYIADVLGRQAES